MKKIITITLASALMLSMFAGCASNTTDDDAITPELELEVPAIPEADAETDADIEVEVETEDGDASADEALAQAYTDAITASRTEDENTYYSILTPFNEDEIDGYDMILGGLGLNADNAENYAISLSLMNTQAYAIIAVMPVEGQSETIEALMQAYVDLQLQNYDMYLIDQFEIAQNAQIVSLEDGTILLVMAENAETMLPAITEALEA